jgi:hypothetical protein
MTRREYGKRGFSICPYCGTADLCFTNPSVCPDAATIIGCGICLGFSTVTSGGGARPSIKADFSSYPESVNREAFEEHRELLIAMHRNQMRRAGLVEQHASDFSQWQCD